ncbi:MAG: DNA glycosylase [Ruthenibacterium sp.]
MVVLQSDDFDIEKIADSGQCFRLTQATPGRFVLIAHGRVLFVEDAPKGAVLHCCEEDYQAIWRNYFDMDCNYKGFRAAVPKEDAFLTNAVRHGCGIRILQQDPWEMLVTFIISQRKNIPAIKRAVELLCEKAGERLLIGEQTYFAFPCAARVAAMPPETLAACALGYRTAYLRAAAQRVASGALDLEGLKQADDSALLNALMSVPGVGPKIANCVMLFGYHRLSGFPRDVWINRVIEQEYHGEFPLARYAGFEGVMQQYMFFYGRSEAYRGSRR